MVFSFLFFFSSRFLGMYLREGGGGRGGKGKGKILQVAGFLGFPKALVYCVT